MSSFSKIILDLWKLLGVPLLCHFLFDIFPLLHHIFCFKHFEIFDEYVFVV